MMKHKMKSLTSGEILSPVHGLWLTADFESHHMLTLMLEGKLFLAPIPGEVQNVLDVGTGTGIWAM